MAGRAIRAGSVFWVLVAACSGASLAAVPVVPEPVEESSTPAVPAPEPPSAPVVVVIADGPPPSIAPPQREIPAERRCGGLLVEQPPRRPTRTIPSRLRTHTEGTLSAGRERVWVGPPVPAHVALCEATLELFLLDEVDGGHLALYRDPYGASSCSLGASLNCEFLARFYDHSGEPIWSVRLNDFFSRPDMLEVQDLRYDNGVLYFNEACQTYSAEAGSQCSSLVAVDPRAGQQWWRTDPLRSNDVFLVIGRYIVSGYGFTNEPDALFVIRRSDGQVVHRQRLRAAHDLIEQDPLGQGQILRVSIYNYRELRFRMVGFNGDQPTLVRLP